MTNDKDRPQAASSEVAKTYLAQVIIQDGDSKRDINEVARYLFSSQITQVSERVLIILGLADEKNVKSLVTALLQRNYIKAACKDGFYIVVPTGLPPRKKTKIKTLTGGERMARTMANDQEFLHFVKSSWCYVVGSLQRAGFNVFDRFPGTALVGDDRYINPVTASRALSVLIEDGIIFAHSDTHYRLTDKAKKILDSKKVDGILPADATPGGVSRSVGDKKHLKTLRRDLREIAVALNTWEFKRDDNRLAAVLVKLWRNSQLEIVKSVDDIFAACEKLVASNNFVFRKGDGFVIKQDDEELRVRMLAVNAVTHSPTQRPSAPIVTHAPVARPPSRDERRSGRTFVPFPPRVPDPVKLPPRPQPVAHSAPAAPVPAKIIPPVVVTAPILVPATVVQQNVALPAVPEVTVEEVQTPTPPPTSVAAVDVIPAPVPAPVPVPVPVPAASDAAVIAETADVATMAKSVNLQEMDPIWIEYVLNFAGRHAWKNAILFYVLTKGKQSHSALVRKILVEKFGFTYDYSFVFFRQSVKDYKIITVEQLPERKGQIITWLQVAHNRWSGILIHVEKEFAATKQIVPKPVILPVAKSDASVHVSSAVGVTACPIDIEYATFVFAQYDYTDWMNNDLLYVITQGNAFETLDLMNVLIHYTNITNNQVSQLTYQSTKSGCTTAVRHGINRRSGKTIYWCNDLVSGKTKTLLAEVRAIYAKSAKADTKKPAAPLVPTAKLPVLVPAAVNAELALSMVEVERLTFELTKASAEAERLNKLLDEATGFFVAEQASHRETAKQLRDEQEAHQATSAKLAKLKDALTVISDFLKTE